MLETTFTHVKGPIDIPKNPFQENVAFLNENLPCASEPILKGLQTMYFYFDKIRNMRFLKQVAHTTDLGSFEEIQYTLCNDSLVDMKNNIQCKLESKILNLYN
jgi:hypothetical protein